MLRVFWKRIKNLKVEMMSSQVVPQGYKQTKVGIVPKEWKEIVLSSFINEKIVYCNDKKVDLGSLTIEKGVVPKPARYNREHLVKDMNGAYKLIETNDFAYNPMNLRFGALALYKNKQPLKVSAYYNIFNVNENIVNLDYIYAYLKSERIMFYYNRMATGSLEEKKRVHFKEFMKFIFPIPSMIEQQKIAKILTTWDNAISKQDELIKTKEEQKKGLMQKLLSGEVRFSGFCDEWEKVRLGELCTVAKSGGTPLSSNKSYYNGNIPFLAISDITKQGKYLTYASKKISQLGLDNSASWIIPVNTIIYSMYASVGYVSINKIPLATSQAVINLILKDTVNIEFIYYFLLDYKKYIHKYIETGTQGNLNAQSVKSLKIKTPSIKEQQKISGVLSNADNEIDLLKDELEELKEQKKGLMQKLLSGEVRINMNKEKEI